MKKVLNRLAYFFNGNYVSIALSVYLIENLGGLTYATWNFIKTGFVDRYIINLVIIFAILLITAFLLTSLSWAFDLFISSDFRRFKNQTAYKALDYKEKTLSKGEEEEKYYVINIDGGDTKVVKADTVLINKQDKFADSEHKAGAKSIEYVAVNIDENLPKYKKTFFEKAMESEKYEKIKRQLNVTNYVSTQDEESKETLQEPTQTKENGEGFGTAAIISLFFTSISLILTIVLAISIITSL